jgi:ParB family chromosome partitioning protein
MIEPATADNTSAGNTTGRPENFTGAATTSSPAASSAGGDRSAVPDKRRALGRGLDSLLPGPRAIPGTSAATSSAAGAATLGREGGGVMPGHEGGGVSRDGAPTDGPQPSIIPELQAVAGRAEGTSVIMLSLERIEANPYQTRYKFHDEDLQELAASINASGVLQPIVVRPGRDGHYILIVGERRMRASKLAGKTTIPAIIRHVSDQQAAEMTVAENLQRQDLNPLEQAFAFARLSKEFKLTQEQIGNGVGISRESVANYMRLLKLPPKVQEYIGHGTLGFSEARVLLTLDNPETIEQIAAQAVKEGLSVDALEVLVLRARGLLETPQAPKGGARWVDPNVRQAQRELEKVLGCRVRIRDRNGKGKITIEYSRLEDFDRVMDLFKKQ